MSKIFVFTWRPELFHIDWFIGDKTAVLLFQVHIDGLLLNVNKKLIINTKLYRVSQKRCQNILAVMRVCVSWYLIIWWECFSESKQLICIPDNLQNLKHRNYMFLLKHCVLLCNKKSSVIFFCETISQPLSIIWLTQTEYEQKINIKILA